MGVSTRVYKCDLKAIHYLVILQYYTIGREIQYPQFLSGEQIPSGIIFAIRMIVENFNDDVNVCKMIADYSYNLTKTA